MKEGCVAYPEDIVEFGVFRHDFGLSVQVRV